MRLLLGKPVAEKILDDVKKKIAESGVTPGLAVILVGNDKPSQAYVFIKEKKAAEIGIHFEKFVLPKEVSESDIVELIRKLNNRQEIHGIIVQMPLPLGIDADKVVATINPNKDADGFHADTIGKFLGGDKERIPVFPMAIMEMVKASGISLHGKSAVVVANSHRFGDLMKKPLFDEGTLVDVIFCDELESQSHRGALVNAQIMITACGRGGLIRRNMVPKAALIIDGGIIEISNKIFGDVDLESFEGTDTAISPVPGGVGPVTVACLLRRVTELAFDK